MRSDTCLRWLGGGLLAGLVSTIVIADRGPAAFAQGSSRPSTSGLLLPAAGSPLAATAAGVFAISADRRHIIARSIDLSSTWQMLEIPNTFSNLHSISAGGNSLFVTDSGAGAVYEVSLVTRLRSALFQGPPLGNPGSIAVARDVFVTDNTTFKLYRIRDRQLREIALDKDIGEGQPLSLAGVGDDLLVASRNGLFSEFRGLGRADPEQSQSPSQQSASISRERRAQEPLRFTMRQRAMPDIEQPSRIALWKGVVYAVDERNKAMFAFGREDQRPIRLSRTLPIRTLNPTSIAVTDQAIYVLNGDDLQRWPRIIPSEVHLRFASPSEAMSLVYEYLHDRNILPIREVKLDKNIENTLKTHRVILAGYPRSLDGILCSLNTRLCDKDGRIRILQPGEPLWVPDLYSENYIDAIPVTLTGRESLGEIADQRVTSPEFAAWRSEERLRELNESQLAKASVTVARGVRKGEYMTPVEYVRYLVPAVAGDASGSGRLKKLEGAFEGIKVLPLEERAVAGAHAAAQDPKDPQEAARLIALKTEFEAMLGAIDYFLPAALPIPTKVGVAEKFIDQEHPDLRNAWLPPEGAQPVPAATDSPTTVAYRIRSFEDADHGTMVAGLIGARRSGFERAGLAPKVILLSLRSSDPAIGEDVRRAFLRGVRLFNVSAHYNVNIIPPSLQQAIETYPKALFIVAAGNDVTPGSNAEVCRNFSVFPACWYDKKNVLVVTATTLSGNQVLPAVGSEKGANWSGKAVHLAAPGEGFHAPAVGRSYAPVRGSSFATPLVTATAALLFGQGVTDPWVIKQRLIATTDPESTLAGKTLSGRLNVRRALSDVGLGVLTRRERIEGGGLQTVTTRIIVDTGRIVVRDPDGDDRPIAARKLRRVQKYGDGFRIIYVDQEQLHILEGATFPNDSSAQFDATKETGEPIRVNLREWSDFVAPALVVE